MAALLKTPVPAKLLKGVLTGMGHAISLIITEYCVFNVQDNFRKNQMDELLMDFVGLSFISELDQLVRKARAGGYEASNVAGIAFQ